MPKAKAKDAHDLAVLRCWKCSGAGQDEQSRRCPKCSGTGSLFWVGGYAYPYTPDGEKSALGQL